MTTAVEVLNELRPALLYHAQPEGSMTIRAYDILQQVREEAEEPGEREFFAKLKRLASGLPGLPVTHETPQASVDDILRRGALIGDIGVFFTVGHLTEKSFVTGPGALIHCYIPLRYLTSYYVTPDMTFHANNENLSPYEALLKKYPDAVGAEIGTGFERLLLDRFVYRIIDNETGVLIWSNPRWARAQ